MVIYFKKYTIAICAIAILLPVIASTLWPLFFGQLMAASAIGLFLMIGLFVAGLFVGYLVFEKKAESLAEGYIAKYNEKCDPNAFLSEGKALAEAIKYPYNALAAWYMSYYAQALLDTGDADAAKEIYGNISKSIEANKRGVDKIGIIANLIPLDEKIDSPGSTIKLIDQGLKICKSNNASTIKPFEDFFDSQKKIAIAKLTNNERLIASLSEKIRSSAQYPMRIRVEYAWTEASACYRLGDRSEERRLLQYVVKNGNKLILVKKAQRRLNAIDGL